MDSLKQYYKTVRALVVVLAISLFVCGCTIKLAYNFLDWGLYWELEVESNAYASNV